MPKFKVCVIESREYFYEIEAASQEDAEEIAKDLDTEQSISDTFREAIVDYVEEILT